MNMETYMNPVLIIFTKLSFRPSLPQIGSTKKKSIKTQTSHKSCWELIKTISDLSIKPILLNMIILNH